jgi:hypothetical protein
MRFLLLERMGPALILFSDDLDKLFDWLLSEIEQASATRLLSWPIPSRSGIRRGALQGGSSRTISTGPY